MSKKSFKKIGTRVGLAVGTGGLSEGYFAGKKLLKGDVKGAVIGASGAGIISDGLNPGQPKDPSLPPAPNTDTTLNQAVDEEALKRKRRANIATRPLGVLVQQALQTRTLTGQ